VKTIVTVSALVASSFAATVALLIAGPAAASSPSSSSSASTSAADKYAVINATVNAATDHEILGSSAFPNFTTGAVDNYYSWAHSHVDNSPFAEGTSSPADSGPIGQTVAAGNFSQPQYADARWPGKDSGKATFGNQGGPYAVANAVSYNATASAEEASSGSSSGTSVAAPKGFASKLRVALAAWKAKWLPRLDLTTAGGKVKLRKLASLPVTTPTLPSVTTPSVTTPTVSTPTVSTPTVSTPSLPTPGKKSKSGSGSSSSGNTGGAFESTSLAQLDPKTGAIVTSGESSLGEVNLGGQIVIDGIHVTLAITNAGKPTDKVSVEVGAATIGGVPVTIDQDGVHINGQGQNLPYQQADDALNGALKQAGVELYTVVPEVKKSANELQVTATGVHVKFTQPAGAPSGVPSQYAEHILGEVLADSLAAPAGPIPKLNLGGAGSLFGSGTTGSGSVGGSTTGTYSTTGSTPASSSTTGASQSLPAAFIGLLSKRTWFLLSYFLWQSLVIGTGASLYYWRLGGATT
jgi:hypothetical protein